MNPDATVDYSVVPLLMLLTSLLPRPNPLSPAREP